MSKARKQKKIEKRLTKEERKAIQAARANGPGRPLRTSSRPKGSDTSTKSEPLARVASRRTLRLVMRRHETYVTNGGVVTIEQLRDQSIDAGLLAQALLADEFGKYLTKFSRGWNRATLIEQAIIQLRTPPPVKVSTKPNEPKQNKAKPAKATTPRRRKPLHIRVQTPPRPSMVATSDKTKREELAEIRQAIKDLLRVFDWMPMVLGEPEDNQFRLFKKFLRQYDEAFITRFAEKFECGRGVIENYIAVVYGELMERERRTPVFAASKRRAARDRFEHPRRNPTPMRMAS